MGCQQSRMNEKMNKSAASPLSVPPVQQRPPSECQGLPPPLLPDLSSTSLCDVDFYIDGSETTDSQPRLACTLTWCKDGIDSADDSGKVPVPELTIDDVLLASTILPTSERRPVVIVCHGFLSWRNQMLISHIAAGVAQKLHCHALRFDFRGNGHSGGTWRSAGFDDELCDLRRVVDYVRNSLGCEVLCIAGHSKGSAAVLHYALEQEKRAHRRGEGGQKEEKRAVLVPCFVNLAGRFVVPGEFDVKTRFSKEQCDELAREGKFTMKTFGEKAVVVTQEDIDERANASSAFVSEIRASHVLTIHGSADTTVDVENAKRYDESISKHTLQIIEGADHNFNGLKHINAIVGSVVGFIQENSSSSSSLHMHHQESDLAPTGMH